MERMRASAIPSAEFAMHRRRVMDNRDREAIEDLFWRIAEVERQAGPRDREAEAYIRDLIARNPSAPYYMAQTIIVQQQALEAAQSRLEEMEIRGPQRAAGGAGFLDSLFGGARQPRPAATQRPSYSDHGAWAGRRGIGMGGGGFLAGAAQTAMGVAGGVVLGSMLADWLSPDEAAAAGLADEAAADEGGLSGGADQADAGAADAGGDFGDFDMGDF
jgi:hypothetical protein